MSRINDNRWRVTEITLNGKSYAVSNLFLTKKGYATLESFDLEKEEFVFVDRDYNVFNISFYDL